MEGVEVEAGADGGGLEVVERDEEADDLLGAGLRRDVQRRLPGVRLRGGERLGGGPDAPASARRPATAAASAIGRRRRAPGGRAAGDPSSPAAAAASRRRRDACASSPSCYSCRCSLIDRCGGGLD